MAKPNLTIERIREALAYNPETGVFVWRIRTSNRSPVGNIAGRDNGNGYRRITLDGETVYAHRLAWAHFYGKHPEHEVDHADGSRSNNRISNLRLATHAQNGQNQPILRSTNTSGYCGVSWSKLHGCWEAYITVKGRKKNLGLYTDPTEAAAAYLSAKAEFHQFQPTPRDFLDA